MEILEILGEFAAKARFYPILGLIGLDLVLGIAAAIKHGEFKLRELGRFYQTMVLPYIMAYGAVYVALQYVPESIGFIADGLDALTFGAVVSRLVASILENFAELNIELEKSAG